MPVVTVSETTGAMVALVLVALLAWIDGGDDRRKARPSPRWTPAVLMTTYPQAEAVCRLLRRRQVACRLMPAAERLDLHGAGGVAVLVPATQIDHARNILSRQVQAVDPLLGREPTRLDSEEQP